MTNSLEQQLLLEDEYQQRAANTHDFKEGIQAFLEKRALYLKVSKVVLLEGVPQLAIASKMRHTS